MTISDPINSNLYRRFDTQHSPQNDEIIKNALIEYYDNGCLMKSSFDRIAKKCGISRTSLYYRFNSKNKLTSAVYFYIGDRIHKKVSEKMLRHNGSYNFQTLTVISRYIELLQFKEDPKAARFYKEYHDTNFNDIYEDQSISYPFYEMHNDIYQLNLSVDEIKIMGTLTEASITSFMLLYFSGQISIPFEEAAKRILSIPFDQMNLPKEQSNEIIEYSLDLFNAIGFKILPYFDIE